MKNNRELVRLAVGEKFPLFEPPSDGISPIDGAEFESNAYGEGYSIYIFLNKPTELEISTVRDKVMELRVLISENEFAIPILGFEDSLFYFELSFNPFAYSDNRAFQMVDASNIATVVLIDSSDNTVKALRSANLPLKFIRTMASIWSKPSIKTLYTEGYKEFYQSIQMNFGVEEVWKLSTAMGNFGETYDLNELKKLKNSLKL